MVTELERVFVPFSPADWDGGGVSLFNHFIFINASFSFHRRNEWQIHEYIFSVLPKDSEGSMRFKPRTPFG